MPLISLVSPTYNEESNVEELHRRIVGIFTGTKYDFELIFIDNASTDQTRPVLRKLAAADTRVKLIFNARNFGHIRSPYYGLLQARGDAAIYLASDLQDPPELIPRFLEAWEKGWKVAVGVKNQSEEFPLFFFLRKTYYATVARLSEVQLINNATGFGIYDRRVIEILRTIDDSYPYFRGLLCEIGFPIHTIPFTQPRRKRGITKNNWYTLYDIAMLGITSHTKVPLRLATMVGFGMGFLSLLTALGYFVYKLVFWNNFAVGIAPLVIGLFFFSSIQLFFIGIVGEYLAAIHTQVLKRPLVVEDERINF